MADHHLISLCYIVECSARLSEAEAENKELRTKAGMLGDYQMEVKRLRDDIALLTARRDLLLIPPPRLPTRSPLLSSKPAAPDESQG